MLWWLESYIRTTKHLESTEWVDCWFVFSRWRGTYSYGNTDNIGSAFVCLDGKVDGIFGCWIGLPPELQLANIETAIMFRSMTPLVTQIIETILGRSAIPSPLTCAPKYSIVPLFFRESDACSNVGVLFCKVDSENDTVLLLPLAHSCNGPVQLYSVLESLSVRFVYTYYVHVSACTEHMRHADL